MFSYNTFQIAAVVCIQSPNVSKHRAEERGTFDLSDILFEEARQATVFLDTERLVLDDRDAVLL